MNLKEAMERKMFEATMNKTRISNHDHDWLHAFHVYLWVLLIYDTANESLQFMFSNYSLNSSTFIPSEAGKTSYYAFKDRISDVSRVISAMETSLNLKYSRSKTTFFSYEGCFIDGGIDLVV